MDRFIIRKKARTVPAVYRDIWTLISAQLEWPELYALTRVSKQCQQAAEPFLLKVLPALKKEMIGRMRHVADLNRYCVWQFMDKNPLKTFKSPFLSTSRANFFGLLKLAFQYQWRGNLTAVERDLNQAAARFCRISSDSNKIGPRPMSWK